MKKSLENKQLETLLTPHIEILSNFSNTGSIEKGFQIEEGESEEGKDQYLNYTASNSSNCESDDIKFQFDNSNFHLSDSETSINFGGFEEESSVSKDTIKQSEEKARTQCHPFNFAQDNSSEIKETKTCFHEVLRKSSKSKICMEQSSSELLLKKTTKITNFNFAECDRRRVADDADSQCPAEVLTATRTTLCRPERSNAHPEEIKMVVMDDFNSLSTSESQFFEIERKSALSELYARPNQSYTESDENISDQDHSGKKSFYNDQTVNIFLKKRSKNTQRSKFTQKKLKPNDNEASAKAGRTILDFEVPPEKDIEIKQYLLDFYFYIIYLIFLTTIALCMVSSNMFYFTDVTLSLFFDTPNHSSLNKTENVSFPKDTASNHDAFIPLGKTLKESNTFEDFWAFAESTMIDLFYWNFYHSKIDISTHTEKDDRKMLYENEILGVPRIRQVRVRNDSCEIHPNVQRFFRTCYDYYSIFSEETRPIKTGMENSSTATAWVYTKAKDLNTLYYWGDISIYGGGGYYLDFDVQKNKTIKMIHELKKNHWVSRSTRAIFIDFNLYNSNVNLFLICKIILEFPPVGGMLPREDFHALKLIRYLTVLDFFILGCEFVLVLFALYFTHKQIFTWIKEKLSFFTNWWNYVDVLIVLLLYTYIILSIVRYIYSENLISQLQNNYYKYTEFATVKELQINYNNVIAVLVFLSWIKLFMYFNFNVRMVEFRKTLSRSLKDILGFFPMFLTMFIAFAVLAYLLFGNQIKDYDSVWSSFLALLQAFLGEFEYAQIQESNQILGPVFYITFIFFIFFVLLNVFIAIINDAYASVKSEVISDTPKTGDYVKRGFLNFFGWCDCRKKKKFKKKPSLMQKLLYQDIKKTLANAGFSDDEINIFFAKYNINVSNIAGEKTRKKVIEDLELQRIDFTQNAEQFEMDALRRQLNDLAAKIEEIDINLKPVIDKVDILLNRR